MYNIYIGDKIAHVRKRLQKLPGLLHIHVTNNGSLSNFAQPRLISKIGKAH